MNHVETTPEDRIAKDVLHRARIAVKTLHRMIADGRADEAARRARAVFRLCREFERRDARLAITRKGERSCTRLTRGFLSLEHASTGRRRHRLAETLRSGEADHRAGVHAMGPKRKTLEHYDRM